MPSIKKLRLEIKNTSLWWRIFAFFALFVIISGYLGPLIINHDLVNYFGFGIYGGAGKALIFAAIAYCVFVWRKRGELKMPRWSRSNVLWLVPGGVFFVVASVAIRRLWVYDGSMAWPVLAHLGIVGVIVCCALATISFPGIRELWRAFRRELLMALAIGFGFYVFLAFVYGLWNVLAATVMYASSWMLTASGLDVNVLPPRYLILDKFGVEISQWCSGIESIALFTGLYVIIGIADRDRLNFRKYAAVFVPALVVVFACNILRVYILIMFGYHVDKDLAFKLFHTYAGMVLFVIVSALFWLISYKWMLKKQSSGHTADTTT